MPLHDWSGMDNWDGFHTYWMTELAVFLRRTLPPPYRVLLGNSPLLALGGTRHRPDVGVTNGHRPHGAAGGAYREPDAEVMVAPLEQDLTGQVERDERLVAAVELISPGNKDRPDSREHYTTRYLAYLHHGVHLLIVDPHRHPIGFSFPQLLSERLETPLPAPPAPSVVAYRVGEPLPPDGRLLAVWTEPLTVGQPLPAVSLPLTVHLAVPIDLEGTYMRAAENCYLT